ncbi:MAG: methyltransferase domain-containing protein [Chlorobi bacterium]|nr:methyltransferase domain-containing protein [Chlorobiota bacterium]
MEQQIKTMEHEHAYQEEHSCGCGSGGCGSHGGNGGHSDLPIKFQILRAGDKVVELGSGTGNDCFAVSQIVGTEGNVVGVDTSEENISIARNFQDQLKISNVEFKSGKLENVPLPNDYADILYCNTAFNLYNDKQKIADEMYRVSNHNGLSCVTDFIVFHDIPEGLRKDAAKFADSISGAESPEKFMGYFRKTGFGNVDIIEINKVQFPDGVFEKHLDDEQIRQYNDVESDKGIFKVTLIAEKPTTCAPETCCCNHEKHLN